MHETAFRWTFELHDYFIKDLSLSHLGMSLLCVLLIVLGVVFEGMKAYTARSRARLARERLRLNTAQSTTTTTVTTPLPPNENATLLSIENQNRLDNIQNAIGMRRTTRILSNKETMRLCLEACSYVFNTTLGYVLMLFVMSYNGYLFVAVISGFALGYLIFGYITMKINMENVQAKSTNILCTSAAVTIQRNNMALENQSEQPTQLSSTSSSAALAVSMEISAAASGPTEKSGSSYSITS